MVSERAMEREREREVRIIISLCHVVAMASDAVVAAFVAVVVVVVVLIKLVRLECKRCLYLSLAVYLLRLPTCWSYLTD